MYRYVGPREAKIAQKSGWVPTVDANSRPKNVFFTTDFFTSAEEATRALQPPSPLTHRITADPAGVSWCYGGNVLDGTGIELTTQEAVRVIRVDTLEP